jgi:hypothetical protein
METEKKTYEIPVLIIYGDVEEITRYVSGTETDGQGGSQIG